MNEYYLTFGVQYAREPHPAGDWIHPDGWVTIVASSYAEARATAVEVFGVRWSDLYDAEFFDPAFFPKGELRRIRALGTGSTAGETRDVPTPGAAG